jgi:hypothetical protein
MSLYIKCNIEPFLLILLLWMISNRNNRLTKLFGPLLWGKSGEFSSLNVLHTAARQLGCVSDAFSHPFFCFKAAARLLSLTRTAFFVSLVFHSAVCVAAFVLNPLHILVLILEGAKEFIVNQRPCKWNTIGLPVRL